MPKVHPEYIFKTSLAKSFLIWHSFDINVNPKGPVRCAFASIFLFAKSKVAELQKIINAVVFVKSVYKILNCIVAVASVRMHC